MKKSYIAMMTASAVVLAIGCRQPVEKANVSVPQSSPIVQKEVKMKKTDASEEKEVAVIETAKGKIVLEFFPEVAPKTVENFKKLASKGFYDGTTFHRVIPGFMIQGGCPNSKDGNPGNDGTGGPGYQIKAEFSSRRHVRGILSMARSNHPDSAGSQFFICVANSSFLDGKYTVFGQVVEGMDVADAIVSVKRDQRDRPFDSISMKVSLEKR